MADDARLSTGLPRHPKTVKLKRRLGASGCWALTCLFLWVADNKSDGNLRGLTDEDIEIGSEWEGELGVFVAALVEVGFLDGSSGSYVVHDWAEHNPWCAARGERVNAARRAALIGWRNRKCAGRLQFVSEPLAEGIQSAAEPLTGGMQSACNPLAKRIQVAFEGTTHHPTQPNPISPDEIKNHATLETNGAVGMELSTSETVAGTPGMRLASLLKTEILNNKPDFQLTQKKLSSWEATADRMIRIDHRPELRIAGVIRWAQNDSFWKANTLSMDSIRKKFDQLELKARQTSLVNPTGGIKGDPQRRGNGLNGTRDLDRYMEGVSGAVVARGDEEKAQ